MGFFEYLICFYCIIVIVLEEDLVIDEEIVIGILWIVVDVKLN